MRSGQVERLSLLMVMAAAVAACGQPPSPEGGEGADCARCDGWNEDNEPSRFGPLVYDYDALPTSGRADPMPWAGDGWRIIRDGIAWRWAGQSVASPVELYEQAFGGNGDATAWERANHGTWGGSPVDSWWGHCNGWAAATLLEPEPLHAAVVNGVRFEVGDVQALLVEMYYGAWATFVGGRCNEDMLALNSEGRAVNDECRDTNAGAFHVVLANRLGLSGAAFAADSAQDYRVFNDVVVGFEVEDAVPITEWEATSLVGGVGYDYPYNAAAATFLRVRTRVDFLPEHSATPDAVPATDRVEGLLRHDTYEYILELSPWGEVLGGEWLGDSEASHPDFLWLPSSHEGQGGEEGDGDNPYIRWEDVQLLARLSRE